MLCPQHTQTHLTRIHIVLADRSQVLMLFVWCLHYKSDSYHLRKNNIMASPHSAKRVPRERDGRGIGIHQHTSHMGGSASAGAEWIYPGIQGSRAYPFCSLVDHPFLICPFERYYIQETTPQFVNRLAFSSGSRSCTYRRSVSCPVI